MTTTPPLVPAELWSFEEALEVYERLATDLAPTASLASDAEDVRHARALQAVLVAHMPHRQPSRYRFFGGVGPLLPEHAVCGGACIGRADTLRPCPWPCHGVAPLLDALEVTRGGH